MQVLTQRCQAVKKDQQVMDIWLGTNAPHQFFWCHTKKKAINDITKIRTFELLMLCICDARPKSIYVDLCNIDLHNSSHGDHCDPMLMRLVGHPKMFRAIRGDVWSDGSSHSVRRLQILVYLTNWEHILFDYTSNIVNFYWHRRCS